MRIVLALVQEVFFAKRVVQVPKGPSAKRSNKESPLQVSQTYYDATITKLPARAKFSRFLPRFCL